ncbi:WAT1-related protein [Acorus calamus]|uniref:WAT1-related protein n=1 Tax=Acorus calamus TaxID=4465 RepID=A0AAV9BYS1_ACOCL|nr:WAT1-related protein [Acorus calamus]
MGGELEMADMKASSSSFYSWDPQAAAMIVIQLLYGGSNILSKLALDHGMSYMVFTVYRHALATLIDPGSLHLRSLEMADMKAAASTSSSSSSSSCSWAPQVAVMIVIQLLYGGSNILGKLALDHGMSYMMEVVNMRSARGRAKLLGTAICVAGALIFIFSKGPLLGGFVSIPVIKLHGKGSSSHGGLIHAKGDWIKGSALIGASFVAYSAWLILQGTVISGLVYYLMTWCVSRKGPVFTAMFFPLSLVVMGTSSAFLFAERLHLGRSV